MARHDVFQLSERKDAAHEEERAGLLQDAEYPENISEVSHVQELETKGESEGRPSQSTAQRVRKNWSR
jgi:hypothetical protein